MRRWMRTWIDHPRCGLALLVGGYLLLGVLYSFVTPVFEASDEIWHYPVVREIRNHGRLPVQEPGVKTDWAQEGSQPPLYYAMGALLTAWIDDSDYETVMIRNPFVKAGVPGTPDNVNFIAHPPGQGPWQGGTVLALMIIRWLSLLMGAGLVYFTWRMVRTLYPQAQGLALLAATLTAFNPMTLFINASVNNDNLLMFLSALVLWLLAEEMVSPRSGVRGRRTLFLGGMLGLAALTKVSGLVLWPTVALGLTLVAWRTRDWRSWFIRGLMLMALALIVAGWWYLRNWQLYGEPFGTERMALIAGPRPEGFGLRELLQEWPSFWYAYWGVFGAFNILAPQPFYGFVAVMTLTGLFGLALRLIRSLRARRFDRALAHLTFTFFLLFTLAGIIRWSLMTPGSQGRLMFGGAGVIALYLALGLHSLRSTRGRGVLSWFAGGLMFLSALVIPFLAIRPAYTPPTPIPALPPDTAPLDARFGDHIRLLGYRLDAPRTTAGEPLRLTLYWQADAPLDENLDLSLNGLGFHEQNVAKLDTWPGRGLWPTLFWQPGHIYPDAYQLPTDGLADTPTVLKLSVRFSRDLVLDGVGKPVPAFANGQPAGDIILDVGDLLTPTYRLRRPQTPPIALLDDGVRLHDYRFTQVDDRWSVTFTWSAVQTPSRDYTIFVHVLDEAENVLAQGDAPPRDGYWPTSHWVPNELVPSTHELALASDVRPAHLLVGMYDPVTGQRLTIRPPEGDPWPHAAMPIPWPQ